MSDTSITTIGFDADDTLWHNERFFQETQKQLTNLLSAFGEHDHVLETLHATERRNIPAYGFGVKGFTLSMIETALEVSKGSVDAAVLAEIVRSGKTMLEHPVELLEGVGDTLDDLAGRFQLLLITKGDLFDQERKIEMSGLAHYFERCEIVSDKTADVYRRIFDDHGHGVRRSVMVGNSLKSDVYPVIEAGGVGVHVPHEHEWEYERPSENAPDPARFHLLESIRQLPDLLSRI